MTIYVKSGDNSKEIEFYVERPTSNLDPTPTLEKAGTAICHCSEMADGSTVPGMFYIEWQNENSSLAATTLSGSMVI